jgi:hypothetical protein
MNGSSTSRTQTSSAVTTTLLSVKNTMR